MIWENMFLKNAINQQNIFWHFSIPENIWTSAVHITEKESTVADYMSRSLSDNKQWQLAPIIFKNIAHAFDFVPELDL